MIKSLLARGVELADPQKQIDVLNSHSFVLQTLPKFHQKLRESNLFPLKPTGIEIFQINLGYMCNMTCKHCHVDAGPDRKEIMTKETLGFCLDALKNSDIKTVDLTGGAPEMNPHFTWFAEQVRALGKKVIVRSNLTILVTPKFSFLPEFFAKNNVEVVSSLPYYSKLTTDKQRGEGAFSDSVLALQRLNELGYGKPDSGLTLNLVYNPAGAFLPAEQTQLELDYKRELERRFNVHFNQLFTITNLPISRYLEYLINSDNLDEYMSLLVNAYNPVAAANVMCRNTISVGWDGFLFDCDFNQMLNMRLDNETKNHVKYFDEYLLNNRQIKLGQHCFGCTAGAGSSCGGATT